MRTILYLLTGLHIGWSNIPGASAQCPLILNCPQGSPVICDISPNDPLLWKSPPQTWSKALETADLYEGSADFSLKVLPCADGGVTSISYVLLLDLDNDNLRETAVSSLNFPPASIVYADNAFNPGYSGGEIVQFDKRAVADSLKFRFALELGNSWDTLLARICWQSGSQYVAPRLPEGRHYIAWRVEQDGVVKYCEHSFRIKDCEAPALDCEQEWAISLDAEGAAAIAPGDLYSEIQDNTTPFPMLELSLRNSGTGTGFPLDSAGQPLAILEYDCETPDTQMVELWAKDRLGNTGFCEVMIRITDDQGACDKAPIVCARTFWDADIVQSVDFKTIWVDTGQKLLTLPLNMEPGGCGVLDALPPSPAFSITATCDTNPLNGVSTFDLLLISRHILGVQALDAPWKWIAADANKNGSITTFDLVEFRKLILGIYTKLPVNTSWRFFPTDCVFPPNPFTAFCPPEYSLVTSPLWQLPAEITFNAVKTGDVNGSASAGGLASPDADDRSGEEILLLPDLMLETGRDYEIPVRLSEMSAWAGFQLGLHLDPALASIVSLQSALPGFERGCWTATAGGELRLSWVGASPRLFLPGDAIFVVHLRALQTAPLREILHLKEEHLRAEYYTETETIGKLGLEFRQPDPTADEDDAIAPLPNPSSGGAILVFRTPDAGEAELILCDYTGRVVFRIPPQSFAAGNHVFDIPASAFPTPGVYVWRLYNGQKSHSGKLLRY